jgi:hypothetical protein
LRRHFLQGDQEIVYDVCLDGNPDRRDTPWHDAVAAISEATALKRANPESAVTVELRFWIGDPKH